MTGEDRRAIDALLRYLPVFEDAPESQWTAGDPPEYSESLLAFMREAIAAFADHEYDPRTVAAWLSDPQFLSAATFRQLRSVITWINRGERFCDGHWASQLKNGNVLRALRRLETLGAEYDLDHAPRG